MPVEGDEVITIEVGPALIPIVDAGTGPGVLLLHEAEAGRDAWAAQVPVLVSAGFRVMVPDLSTLADSDPESVADVARGLLRVLGVPRVHAVGQGSGAAAAWQLCARHPARVERLVVVGWSGDPGGSNPMLGERAVLVVRGGGRGDVGEAQVAALAGSVKTPVRVETLDGAAKSPSREAPDEFNRLLLDFLASPARAPRPARDVRAMVGRSTRAALARRLRGQA